MEDALVPALEFPADRAPVEVWAASRGVGNSNRDLVVINIKSRGRWAVFLVDHSRADCLFREGVLGYAGPATGWLDALPLDERERQAGGARGALLSGPAGPMLAPLPRGAGVMAIDYDTRQAWALTDDFITPALKETRMSPTPQPGEGPTLEGRKALSPP